MKTMKLGLILMVAGCSISIKTPQGTSVFEGNQWEILSRLVSGEIARIVAAQVNDNAGNDLDITARGMLKVFKAYHMHRKRLVL